MLNGVAPIILFQFSKWAPGLEAQLEKIPLGTFLGEPIPVPPIPLYLDEGLTGIYIDSEQKNIDIETKMDTASDGEEPLVTQKGLGETVTINMIASQDSLGVTLLAAMSSIILTKVTSAEYSITYMHGAIVLFNGLLHSISIEPESDRTLYRITMVLSRGKTSETKKPAAVTEVAKDPSTLPLTNGVGPATSKVAPPPVPAPAAPTFNLGATP